MKRWTQEEINFLIEHKDLERPEVWELFCKTFPNTCKTFPAFVTKRSEIGAVKYHGKGNTQNTKEIGTEQVKKGYVRIKVAQPNVWRFKHHVIYEESTGDKVISKKETVLFLDLNNRNFNPDNLIKISRSLIARVNSGKFGFLKPGDPENNRLIIANAQLEQAIFDRSEKQGLVVKNGNGRVIRTERNRKARERRNNLTPEEKKQKTHNNWERIKADPERHEKIRAYRREYHQRRKEEKKKNDYGKNIK